MKLYLPLDNSQLKSIIDVIKKHYPLGLKPSDPGYIEYTGYKELEDIIVENIHDNKKYKKIFVSFTKAVAKSLKKEVIGTTYGIGPSFSAEIILETYDDDAFSRVKKLSFAISLIGPFFTIYGVDETFIKMPERPGAAGYHAINIITVSPFQEFEPDFNYLRGKIEKEFDKYKFVPFFILSYHIEGLHLFDGEDDDEYGNVFRALFNHLLNGYDMSKTRG